MQVKLNRNGWHCRLQKFVFGKPPEFNSLCPFFWLTIFSLLASPFVGLGKLAFKGLTLVFAGLLYLDEKFLEPWLDQKLERWSLAMSELEVLTGWNLAFYYENGYCGEGHYGKNLQTGKEMDSKTREKFLLAWKKWKEAHPDWRARISEYRQKLREKKDQAYSDRLLAEEKARASEANRKKFFLAVIKYTKFLVIPPALAVSGLVFWLVGSAIGWVAGFIWFYPLECAIGLGAVIAGALTLIGIGFLGFVFKEWLDSRPGRYEESKPSKIGAFFEAIPDRIGEFVDFFVTYFKAAKENYCPAIEWQEENK